MSENLEKAFIKTIIQSWLKSMDCTNDSSDPNRMFIQKHDYEYKDERGFCKTRFGVIQFYDRSLKRKLEGGFYGDIMELSIYEEMVDPKEGVASLLNKLSSEPIYFLHFEMHDFEFVLGQLSSFFAFVYQTEEKDDETKEVPKKIENILICCTCGLTSSYYASLLKNKLDEDVPDNTIQVNGANVDFISTMIDDYDIVLLAPQVYYMEKELKNKYGEKVQLVNRKDFATFSFNCILEKLQNTLKNQFKYLHDKEQLYIPTLSYS